ncbi:MAG: SIMPL domain-containing protein, partial [bacterium]
VKGFGQTISVTGAAYKPITSDFGIWEATVSASAVTLEATYREIHQSMAATEAFLQSKGFSADQYQIGSVQIMRDYNREGDVVGFRLMQDVRIELADVPRISDLAKEVSALIEQGVEINSYRPQDLFTKLDALKLEMIKAATENAMLRAQQLAETTGRKVGAPSSAAVGVFQIRPLHSQEVSSMGMSDVSSIDKEIVSTVHVEFLFE